MQDAAYETLLKRKRQMLHARVATAILEHSPETVEQRPEVLAHHCTEAGQVDRAVGYWRQAGQLAMNRSATAEAIASCRAGLRTLMSLPETPERNRQELAIQLALGSAFVAAHGFAAQSTGEAYERARTLCEKLGEEAQLYPVLYGLCLYHLYGANLPEARRHAARLMEMAKSSNDHGALFFARRAAGVSDLPSGRFIEARAHLEQALELYDPVEHSAPVFVYAFDPRVVCLDYLSRTLFPLGYVKTALARSAEALDVARQSGHRNSLALPLFFGGTIRQLCGQANEVRMRAAELLALAEEEGFTLWAAGARILTGWVSSVDGQREKGEVLLRRGIEEWQSTGAAFMMPYFLALLAEARLRAGAQSESVALLDEALARIERSGERWFEAEVHRIRGGALAAKEANTAAEASHTAALRVAEKQQATLWRLRATISLAVYSGAAGFTDEAVAATAKSLDALPERLDIPEIRKAERIVAGIA
jgi:predicted ATPase